MRKLIDQTALSHAPILIAGEGQAEEITKRN
jgi:hypothetical protein